MSDPESAMRGRIRLGSGGRHHLTVSPMRSKPHDVAGVGLLFNLLREGILKRREGYITDEPLGPLVERDHAEPKLA